MKWRLSFVRSTHIPGQPWCLCSQRGFTIGYFWNVADAIDFAIKHFHEEFWDEP